MNLAFTYDIVVGSRSIKVKELSFNQVKTLSKLLMFKTDPSELKPIFNNLIKQVCVEEQQLNILEKIVLLLNLRGLTFGKDISISYNGKNIVIQNDAIVAAFDRPVKPFHYRHDKFDFVFGVPNNFISDIDGDSIAVYESIQSFTAGKDTIDLTKITEEQKSHVFENLPVLPFFDIHRKIYDMYKDLSFTVDKEGEVVLDIFDSTFLTFFKFIFDPHYQQVLDLEYSLRKYLHFTNYDFEKELQQKTDEKVE